MRDWASCCDVAFEKMVLLEIHCKSKGHIVSNCQTKIFPHTPHFQESIDASQIFCCGQDPYCLHVAAKYLEDLASGTVVRNPPLPVGAPFGKNFVAA